MFPKYIYNLIGFFAKFHCLGKNLSEKLTFELLNWNEEDIKNFSESLKNLKKSINKCPDCNALVTNSCEFCNDTKRDKTTICVIASSNNLFKIDSMGNYDGLYHVLEYLINPMYDVEPQISVFKKLEKQIKKNDTKTLILALDTTVSGDATSQYVKKIFTQQGITTYRLCMGIPMGSTLDFVDKGTLISAFNGRKPI